MENKVPSTNFTNLSDNSKAKQLAYILIPLAIGLIAMLIYIFSGQSSQDYHIRQLHNTQKVEAVEIKEEQNGQKTATVKCKTGESYGIYYPPGSSPNYEALSNDKCEE